MEMIYKTMLLVLLTIFLVAGGFAVSNACVDVINANNYFEEVSQVIAESNYNANIIDFCCQEASENGYGLVVNVSGNTRPGVLHYAKATFTYKYEMEIFGVSIEKKKEKIF